MLLEYKNIANVQLTKWKNTIPTMAPSDMAINSYDSLPVYHNIP
jgi:hypothetical protein